MTEGGAKEDGLTQDKIVGLLDSEHNRTHQKKQHFND